MFSVNRKLCLPLIAITVLSLVLAAPVLAGNLIGNVFPITNSDKLYESNVALAYNTAMQEYLAVWSKDTVEDEIWAQRLDIDGNQVGAPFLISKVAGHTLQNPDVAYNSLANQYLVVWQDHRLSDGWTTVQARRVLPIGAVLDTFDILISNLDTGVHSYKPAVAYSPAADRYTVVWVEQLIASPRFIIYARTLKSNLDYDVIHKLSESAYRHFEPDIAYNHSADRHLVVWEELIHPANRTIIRGCQVYGDGGKYSTAFEIFNDIDYLKNAMAPAVAAISTAPGNIKFMVVFDYEYSTTDHDIYGAFIETNGAINSYSYLATSLNKESAPAVAGSEGAGEFLIAWREDVGPGDNRIKVTQYDRTGAALGSTYEFSGEAAGLGAAAAGPQGDFLVAWQDHLSGQNSRDLFGVLFGYRNYAPLIGR